MKPVSNQRIEPTHQPASAKQVMLQKALLVDDGTISKDLTSKAQHLVDQPSESISSDPVLTPGVTPPPGQLTSSMSTLNSLVADPTSGFGMPVANSINDTMIEVVMSYQLQRNTSNKIANQTLQMGYEMGLNEKDTSYKAADEYVRGVISGGITAFAIDTAGFAMQVGAGRKEVATERSKNILETHTGQAEHLKANVSTAQTDVVQNPGHQAQLDAARQAYANHITQFGPGQAPTSAVNGQAFDMNLTAPITAADHARLHGAHLQDVEAQKNVLAGQANKFRMMSIGLQSASQTISRTSGEGAKSVHDKAQAQLNADAGMKRTLKDTLFGTSQAQSKEQDAANGDVHKAIDLLNAWIDKTTATQASIIHKM